MTNSLYHNSTKLCILSSHVWRLVWYINHNLHHQTHRLYILTAEDSLCPTYRHKRGTYMLNGETNAYTVYPKKYAHGFCFTVLCCGYTLTDFPISIKLTSLALWQSNDCPSASKATLRNMDKYFMWIHYERLHNHNKAKHNKTVCIFLGIYCTDVGWFWSFKGDWLLQNEISQHMYVFWKIIPRPLGNEAVISKGNFSNYYRGY